MWIYVGKAAQDVNIGIVQKYICHRLPDVKDDDLVVEQLKTLGKTNSFKIGIDSGHFDSLNKCDFWPNGIVFRRFNFKRHSLLGSQGVNLDKPSTLPENF